MRCPFVKCGAEWEPRVSNPIQCPRCKRVLPRSGNGNRSAVGSGEVGGVVRGSGVHASGSSRRAKARVESSGVRMPDVEARDDHGKDFAATSGKDWKPTSPVDGVMCSYREYDPDTGETYACGLREHLPKVRHTRGAVV